MADGLVSSERQRVKISESAQHESRGWYMAEKYDCRATMAVSELIGLMDVEHGTDDGGLVRGTIPVIRNVLESANPRNQDWE